MIDEYPGPMALDEIKNTQGWFKMRELAQVIALPGEDYRDAANRARGYVSKGFLHPFAKDADDKRGAFLFDDAAVLGAALFSEMARTGLASTEASNAVMIRLFSATTGDPARDRNPLTLIWKTYLSDPTSPPGWTLRIQWRRHVVTGEIVVRAGLIWVNPKTEKSEDFGTNLRLPEGFYPFAEMLLPIDPILPALWERIDSIRRAN